MKILFIILAVSTVALISLFIKSLYNKTKGEGAYPVSKGRIAITFSIFLFLLTVPVAVVHFYTAAPVLETDQQQLEYYSTHNKYKDLNDVYYSHLGDSSYIYKLHYKYVNSLTNEIASYRKDGAYDAAFYSTTMASKRLVMLYEFYIEDGDFLQQDIGRLFLVMHYTDLEKYDEALKLIANIDFTTMPYYHFVKGRCYAKNKTDDNFAAADSLLSLSLTQKVVAPEAYNELGNLYYYFGEDEKLEALINTEGGNENTGAFLKRIVFMRSMAFIDLWKTLFVDEIGTIIFWSFTASLLILLLCFFYLRRIDVFKPKDEKGVKPEAKSPDNPKLAVKLKPAPEPKPEADKKEKAEVKEKPADKPKFSEKLKAIFKRKPKTEKPKVKSAEKPKAAAKPKPKTRPAARPRPTTKGKPTTKRRR